MLPALLGMTHLLLTDLKVLVLKNMYQLQFVKGYRQLNITLLDKIQINTDKGQLDI